ncbi:MAG: hypothetical protein AB1610_00885 [Nitrospirota bacterium]
MLFDVLNEFMEDVPNATITFQHQLLPELIYKVKTGADGTVMQYDIPEGKVEKKKEKGTVLFI